MKFGYAWTFGEAPRAGKTNPVITAPAGWPAEFELGRLTPAGLFPRVGGLQEFGSDILNVRKRPITDDGSGCRQDRLMNRSFGVSAHHS